MPKDFKSKSHPAHYLMHKYWGRKAHNLVAEYISHYSNPGDMVLDPFMGSGGVVIESKKLGRSSIGVDINPITKLIVNGTLSQANPDDVFAAFKQIYETVPDAVKDLSVTKCPECSKNSLILNAVWYKEEIKRIKGLCATHDIFRKNADSYDKNQVKRAAKLLNQYKDEVYFPKDRVLDYVRRNGKSHINQLFSDRNLLQSAFILKAVDRLKNKDVKELCLLAFTSMLPNVSSMIPADMDSITGKSGWQISKFWVPKQHTEKNVLISYEMRINKIRRGKLETKGAFSDAGHLVKIASSEDLSFIGNNSIDYIFTDPPYGDSIAYLGLSMFWNAWLKYEVDYDSEIIYDMYRGKDMVDYQTRLDRVYAELYRVLKPNKYMSFTFHSRNLKFWKAIAESVVNQGFVLHEVRWQPQAVSSGTQGINRKNTLRGDFVYTFTKPRRRQRTAEPAYSNGEDLVRKYAAKLITLNGYADTAKLYELVIPEIVNRRAFLNGNGKILNIDSFLASEFTYAEVNDGMYGWTR